MECPYCKQEMVRGVLRTARAGDIVRFRTLKWWLMMPKLKLTAGTMSEFDDAETWYCPACGIVLAKPDPEEVKRYNREAFAPKEDIR